MKIFPFLVLIRAVGHSHKPTLPQKTFFTAYKIVIILSTTKLFNEKCHSKAAFSNFSLFYLKVE